MRLVAITIHGFFQSQPPPPLPCLKSNLQCWSRSRQVDLVPEILSSAPALRPPVAYFAAIPHARPEREPAENTGLRRTAPD